MALNSMRSVPGRHALDCTRSSTGALSTFTVQPSAFRAFI
jgi:hypothetical protein